jgi:nitrogen fixation protein FixH
MKNAMKKWHWGHGLAAAMALFALFMLYFVWLASGDSDAEVRGKAYEAGLRYEERLEAARNAARFAPCSLEAIGRKVYWRVRGEKPEGRWTFRYAADARHDFSRPLRPVFFPDYWQDSTDAPLAAPGLWTVEVEWTDGRRPFFYQQKIQLP